MADVNTTTEWLRPQSIMLIVATIALVAQAVVTIIGIIKFMWKVATKDDIKRLEDNIKSLKADTEHDVESLKTDTERDTDSLVEDLREVRQSFTNHLDNHPHPLSAKNESRREDSGPPSIEDFKTLRKGESTADERDKRTGS